MSTEAKEAALSSCLTDPTFAHAENILVALREHEARSTPHEVMIDDLYARFITDKA